MKPKSRLNNDSANTSEHADYLKSVCSDDVMEDFKVPNELRKKLEYPSVIEKRRLAVEHAEKKLADRLASINLRLREDKIKVSIQRSGDSLVIQATLPIKPTEKAANGKVNKQTKISLGIPFNAEGLKTAEEEARELGKLIARKTFVWNEKYLKTKRLKSETVVSTADLLKDFECKYFLNRKKNRQSLHTFNNHAGNIKRFLDLDQDLSDTTIITAIQKTSAGSGARQGLVSALSVFCRTVGYDFDFRGYKNGYIPKKRNLPTDQQIEDEINKLTAERSTFQADAWQWVYGMLATYGLRPHEIFAVNIEKFTDSSNDLYAVTLDESLTDGVKTGERVIFPLHIKWVKFFDLQNVRMPKIIKVDKNIRLEHKAQHICVVFKRKNISFKPYDLRHAYAVRGHILGIPIKEMADNMGHSVEMHTKIYQKYLTLDGRRIVYRKAINLDRESKDQQNELKVLQDKLAILQSDNAALKSEVEKLRVLLAKYQLNDLLPR